VFRVRDQGDAGSEDGAMSGQTVRDSLFLLVATALVAAGPLGATATQATKTGTRARPTTARPGTAAAAHPASAASANTPVEPRLYLAWGAPYGMPGARRNLDFTCTDTSKVDTLYLSFETGADTEHFYAMFARLSFRSAPGDTLGDFWYFGRKGVNRDGLKIQFDPDGTFPCSQPWNRAGMGSPTIYHRAEGTRLDLFYAVSLENAIPSSGRTRYCYARLLLDRKQCRLAGSRQPVCIEWEQARYSIRDRDIFITGDSEGLVTVNSPDSSVCAPLRSAARVRAWWPRWQLPPKPVNSTSRPGGPPAK
jgi:hypothetical protein